LIDLLTEADEMEAAPYQRAIRDAEAERANLLQELKLLRSQQAQQITAATITVDDVRAMLGGLFAELRDSVAAGEIQTTKAALSGLVERIELDPVSEACVIHYRIANPDTGVIVASPRGFEPLYSP